MKIIAIILVVGVFTLIVKVGLIFFETLKMNFEFDLPWPEDTDWLVQTQNQQVPNEVWSRYKEAEENIITSQQDHLFL